MFYCFWVCGGLACFKKLRNKICTCCFDLALPCSDKVDLVPPPYLKIVEH